MAGYPLGACVFAVTFHVSRFTLCLAHTLFDKLGGAFDDADRVVVTDGYGKNEAPIPGVTGRMIADEIAAHGHQGASYEPRLERVHRVVGNMLESGDLILSLGAGNINEQLSEDGDVRLYEPLSKHTTLRVGGPAQFWVEPPNEKALAELIRFCRDDNLPLFVMGRGSNLLVRDGGIEGVVIRLGYTHLFGIRDPNGVSLGFEAPIF